MKQIQMRVVEKVVRDGMYSRSGCCSAVCLDLYRNSLGNVRAFIAL